MKSLFQLNIPRRSRSCAHCGKGFKPGFVYVSKLQESLEGGYLRFDSCPDCWSKEILKPTDTYWKSRIPSRDPLSNPDLEKDERALYLFKRAVFTEPGDLSREETFVLALYLARKKVLLWRQEIQTPEGEQAVLFEIAETEEMLGVPKVDLGSMDITAIQQKLAERLTPPT